MHTKLTIINVERAKHLLDRRDFYKEVLKVEEEESVGSFPIEAALVRNIPATDTNRVVYRFCNPLFRDALLDTVQKRIQEIETELDELGVDYSGSSKETESEV